MLVPLPGSKWNRKNALVMTAVTVRVLGMKSVLPFPKRNRQPQDGGSEPR